METEKASTRLSVGRAGIPGDLVLLHDLAAKYGLTELLVKLSDAPGGGMGTPACGADNCSNECTHLCAECVLCPANCGVNP